MVEGVSALDEGFELLGFVVEGVEGRGLFVEQALLAALPAGGGGGPDGVVAADPFAVVRRVVL